MITASRTPDHAPLPGMVAESAPYVDRRQAKSSTPFALTLTRREDGVLRGVQIYHFASDIEARSMWLEYKS
jgi:hypothetical protein